MAASAVTGLARISYVQNRCSRMYTAQCSCSPTAAVSAHVVRDSGHFVQQRQQRFSFQRKLPVAQSGSGEAISTGGAGAEPAVEIPESSEPDSTASEALYNCVNILLGCGILTIPYALNEGGWAAFGVLALMGISTNYTGKVLIKCQDYYLNHPDEKPAPGNTLQLKNGTLETYEDIAELAFGARGRQLISLILYTELLGTCALFLLLQKDHVSLLLQRSGMGFGIDDTTVLVMALAAVLPTTWLPDLSALAYVGAAGVFSALAITSILGFEYFANASTQMPTELVHPETLPLTFGLMAFVFAGHAVFPTIYQSMKVEERKKFPQVIDTSFLIVAAVCSIIGFTGYSTYGSGALEEVTLNLPSGYLQIAAFALVLISPFAKFALTLEPVAQGVDNISTNKLNLPVPELLQKRVVRTGLATSTLVLAAKVPFFGIFMAILGSFLTMTVSVLFPCCANLKMHWNEMSESDRALNFGILSVGMVATVAGTAAAIQSLVGNDGANGAMNTAMSFAQNEAVFKVLVCGSVCNAV